LEKPYFPETATTLRSGCFIVMDSFEDLEVQHDKAPELVDSAAHQEFIKRCRPHGLSHFVID